MFVLYIISVINGLVAERCHFQKFWVGSKPIRSNFFIFFEPRNKREKIFLTKFREQSALFSRFFFFRFFPVQIFLKSPENRFFGDKSVEKSDFLFPG